MCPSALHLSTHPSDKRSKTINRIVDRKLQTQEQLEFVLSDQAGLHTHVVPIRRHQNYGTNCHVVALASCQLEGIKIMEQIAT